MSMNKICPICQSEYYPEVQTCADCGVALEWSRGSVAPRKPDTSVWDSLASGEVLGQVSLDSVEIIEAYLGHLAAADIIGGVLPLTRYQRGGEFAPDLHTIFGAWFTKGSSGQVPVFDGPRGVTMILFVGKADWERADALIGEIFADLHPDNPDGYYLEFDSNTCPACGTGILPEWEECPDCGLSF